MTSNTFWCVLFLFSLIWSYTWFSLISFSLTYWSSVCLLTSTYLRLSSFSTCWFQGWIVYPACFQFYINLLRIIWAEKYLNLSDPSANQREQARGKKKSKTHKHFLQQNHITENLWSPIMIDVSSIATKFIWHQNHVGGTRVTWICDTFKDREAKNHQEGLLTPDGPLGKQSLLCEWISQDLKNAWWFMEYVAYILW